MASPIWKDYYVSLGTADSVEYRILCNSEVIYTGKAWKRPGEDTNKIRINEICADYLEQSESSLSTFVVQTYSLSSWVQKASVQFYNDWSYDDHFSPVLDGIAQPVNKRIDRRQWVSYSSLGASSIKVLFYYANGTHEQMNIPIEIPEEFEPDTDFLKDLAPQRTGTAFFRLPSDNVVAFSILGERYEVVESCCKYVLYYENAYGGWDSLLIEGNHSMTDNLTRQTRTVEYDNQLVQNRGTRNYINEITKTITLHTSWLSDEESLKMHHLLNSCKVYLYDMEKDYIIPVVLTNTTTSYKTYKNNGCQLVNYAIELSFADSRIRR